MNTVVMMGRLTRDPEVRYAEGSGAAVARYSLAVNRSYKREGEPEADFFNCVVFGSGAEFADKYLKQATKIVIRGRVENDNYTNKNGEKVYGTRIVVEQQDFAESKKSTGEEYMEVPDDYEEELPFEPKKKAAAAPAKKPQYQKRR